MVKSASRRCWRQTDRVVNTGSRTGSFQRHSEPFSFASSGQREEIALHSGVQTRRSRMKESKRPIGSQKGFLMRAINSYQKGAFIQQRISKERITSVLRSVCLQGRPQIVLAQRLFPKTGDCGDIARSYHSPEILATG
ncbi:uncharacterized [Tachysurus ichikawai]